MLHVSRKDEYLELSLDGASILLSELRVRPFSNWKTPHQVLGKGGASILLTDEEFCQFVGEYLRYSLQGSVTVNHSQSGWNFAVKSDRKS